MYRLRKLIDNSDGNTPGLVGANRNAASGHSGQEPCVGSNQCRCRSRIGWSTSDKLRRAKQQSSRPGTSSAAGPGKAALDRSLVDRVRQGSLWDRSPDSASFQGFQRELAEDRNPDTNILLRLPRTLSQSYGVLVGRPDIDPPRCRYDSKVSTRSDQHALPASLFPSGTESALCSLARASITAQSRTGAPPRQDWAMRSSSASSARR